MFWYYSFIFLLGLVFGSFLTSFPYRLLIGELFPKGRSYCPQCKKQINWYDNIPLLSFILLKGKCRNCKKKIPLVYPITELSTGLLFVWIATGVLKCASSSPLCSISSLVGLCALPFLLFITFCLLAIFITDMEEQIIPDELSFILFVTSFFVIVLSGTDGLYLRLLCGFAASLFLLILHLITLGRGMGLGDVKLALSLGIILGWPYVVVWLMGSFVLGAVVGVVLIVFGMAKFGKHIAFGPFLIISFFIVLLWGDTLVRLFMPYL